jgi:hypothetical protein
MKVPYKFYKKNMKGIYALFVTIMIVNGTIGYFIKSYYNFPQIASLEVVFFVSVLLHFALVQIIYKKRIKEFNEAEQKNSLNIP